jgi:hypothetical protein
MPNQEHLAILLGPFGLTVGLLWLVWSLLTERLVPGKTHQRVVGERDRAINAARRSVAMTRRALDPDETVERNEGA